MQLLAGATHFASLVTAGEADQLPVLPHMGELIFGLIAIAILYVIVQKKVVPNLEKAYAEATHGVLNRIAEQIAAMPALAVSGQSAADSVANSVANSVDNPVASAVANSATDV